jgi:dihydrofolate synthase / folylpolyglutamate synthase
VTGSAQLPPPSLWADSTDGAIGEVVLHYRRGVRRVDLAAVQELWRAAAPASVPDHVVVVGTNGKTSTATYLARLLRGLGIKAGLYTSPHIARWPERLLIDGAPCADEDLLATLSRFDAIAQALATPVREALRFFDLLTLVAEDLFARAGVEIGVFEAGIGGRLDATRILDPRIVALTSIGLDHRELLGDTPREILLEKLAVASPGATIVSAPLARDLARAQSEWAAQSGVSLVVVEPTPRRERARTHEPKARREGAGRHESGPWEQPPFQRQNMAVAERACREAVARFGVQADQEALARAAELVEPLVLGRFQRGTVEGAPFLADSGHNVTAWSELFATIDALQERFVVVLALTLERNPTELAEAVSGSSAIEALITTTTRVRPGYEAERLLVEFGADGAAVSAEELPEHAFEAGVRLARQRSLSVLVTGSTYLVADFLAWLREHEGYGTLTT